jgi:site-specific recombinase XerD
MNVINAIAVQQQNIASPGGAGGLLTDFGEFLRLNVADGDAKATTLRNYRAQAKQFLQWCNEKGLDPAQATEKDIRAYRRHLVDQDYTRGTIAFKLAVVRRLFDAAQWRGLRMDNPAKGIKAPKDKTAREERVKFLPLEGLKSLLVAPQGDGTKARRDRAILALMGIHGLRVAEVAGLEVGDLDLGAGVLAVTGKGDKTRTIYLIPRTVAALADWLEVRPAIARADTTALFVAVGPRAAGSSLSSRGIRAMVDRYLGAVGLKAEGISCHALRHSAATWARAGGAKLDAIAGMLGHANVTTTQVYAQIVDKMTENPAHYLEALMGA